MTMVVGIATQNGTNTADGTSNWTPVTASTNARVQSAATTNATSVKTSAGTLMSIAVGNNGAAAAYLKLYNKASAPTVGTDTPVATFYLPITTNPAINLGAQGLTFSIGIAYAITALATDADATAVGANQVVGSIGYL